MNQHTIQLWNYIKYAPDNIQAKYTNDTKKYIKDKLNLNWFNDTNNQNTCFFNGLKFHENKVLVINIHIITPNQKLQYLDITQSFNQLLKLYNIFYLSAIIPIILQKYYRESSLADNLIPYIETNYEHQLPKFKYKLKSNNARYRKFTNCNRHNPTMEWNKILIQSFQQISHIIPINAISNQRPSITFYDDYSSLPKLLNTTNKYKPPRNI